MNRIIAILLLAVSSPAFAGAHIEFSQYEGPEKIETGQGGSRIQKNGIDYWTMGTPPRRYQVLGAISDRRDEEWDGGHAIGSPRVARMVKTAGGDAVILLDQKDGGATGGGGFGGLFALGGSKTSTTMLVIKYLD